MKYRALQFALILIISLGVAPLATHADIQIVSSDITVTTNPPNPSPNTSTTITLGSYATDLNKASITWQSNGQTVLSGIGDITYSFTTGNVGVSKSFSVSITPAGSATPIIKNISVQPSDMDVLWEATDSYAPPFYEGKALPSSEAGLRVVALPNTTTSAKNMVYDWKLNYDAVQDASGYGKNSYSFNNSSVNSVENVDVAVSSVNNTYSEEGSVSIPIIKPQILFYQGSQTDGIIYENALSNSFTMPKTDNEMTVVAEPYFLSLKGNASDFTYAWQINGADTDTPANPRELTVQPSSRGGYATISLSIESISKLLQTATQSLTFNL